jgi:hypothetical protein
MQRVNLELDHHTFYCPATGDLINTNEFFQPSPATLFTFLDDMGDFQQAPPELQMLWDQIEMASELDEDDLSTPRLFERFVQRVDDN